MIDRVAIAVSLLLFAGAAGLALRACLTGRRQPVAGLQMLTAAGIAGHVLTLAYHFAALHPFPAFCRVEMFNAYSIAVALAYLYVGTKHECRCLHPIVLALLTASSLAALSGHGVPKLPQGVLSPLLTVHIGCAFMGYGLFTLESVFAVAYLIQDWNLKHKHFGTLFHQLPSLEALDRLMAELIFVAFALFTGAIGLGVFLAHHSGWGRAWTGDPKIVATAVAWAVYALLTALRLAADRHGRKMAWVALLGLVCVLFAFVGVHFVAHSLHDFFTVTATAGGVQ